MVRYARMFVLFLGFVFSLTTFGCKEKETDPVAYNSSSEAQQKRLAEYNQVEQRETKPGYEPSKVGIGEKIGNRWDQAKNAATDGAKTAGQMVAIVVFHLLMFFIPLLVIFLIPGFALGDFEMAVEGMILTVVGFVLLCSNWIGELSLGWWVVFSMLAPAIILFLVGLSGRKEGWWKIVLVMGPPVFMTGLAMLRVLDSAMTALVHGSFLALLVVVVIIYFIVRDDDDNKATAGAAQH